MKSHRVDGDPVGSEAPRGKARFQRKSGRDPGFTPTELLHKAKLMKQFCRLEGPSGASEAYVSSPAWCDCGRHLRIEAGRKCERCEKADDVIAIPDGGRTLLYPRVELTQEQIEASREKPGDVIDTREPACVQRWPGCESGGYDPRCCRFPKSCSC